MPKGVYERRVSPPKKVYPDWLVARIREMYCVNGLTIAQVAAELNLTPKVVQRAMWNHSIPRRVATKRNQRGEHNHMWKGAAATYGAYHHRVESLYGTPQHCVRCGTTDPARCYDWANLTGDYPNPADYERMCRSCHRRYDQGRR